MSTISSTGYFYALQTFLMSRLDSAIRRLQAQRVCLDWAVSEILSLPGPVLELGLGNGRTYDHLRSRLPERKIFVFERKVAAHPECIPGDDYLFEGDVKLTLPNASDRIGELAALAHCDIGSGHRELAAQLAAFIGPALTPLLTPGAIVAADQPFLVPELQPVDLPKDVAPGRYHLYRKK